MKTRLLIPAVALVSACAPLYEPPARSPLTADVEFISPNYVIPLGEITLIEREKCRPLKRVLPVRTAAGVSSTFPQGQPVSLMVAFHGTHGNAYGSAPFKCKYGFTFTPEGGKEYRLQAKEPRSFWTLSDSEAKTGRIPNRLPDRSDCEADLLERTGPKDVWRNAARERICADAQ